MTEKKTPTFPEDWGPDNYQWKRSRAWARGAGIEFELLEGEDAVRIEQTQIKEGGRIYTNRELHEKARWFYPDKKYKIYPVTYHTDVDSVSPEWIRQQMELFDVKPKDLAHQLALTKASVSIAINGTRPIAPHTKALIFYYFLAKELSGKLYQTRSLLGKIEGLARDFAQQGDAEEALETALDELYNPSPAH